MSRPLYLHIGYPKTGTKTVQRHLFPNHSGIDFLGRPYPDPEIGALMHALAWHDSVTFDEAPARARAERLVLPRLNGDKVALISDERPLEAGGTHAADRGLVVQRAKALFGDCRIILVVRNQADMLRSLAVYDNRNAKHYRPLDQWLSEMFAHPDINWLAHLKYAALVRFLRATFGEDAVGVFLFEDLKRAPDEFFRALARFMEIDEDEAARLGAGRPHENKRASAAWMTYTRMRAMLPGITFSKVLPGPVMNVVRRTETALRRSERGAEIRIPDPFAARIAEHFAPDNRRLAEITGMDLAGHGYPL